MYYLQSRYYDPTICRFINADSLASTGQEFVGYNMFAYCCCNPVNYIDDSGCAGIWYLLKELAKWGFIHQCVQEHIKCNSAGISTELWLSRNGVLFGRADVLSENGEVWEIKYAGKNPDARARFASLQALSYIGGIAVRNGTVVVRLGDADAFSGSFVINVYEESYLVEYKTPDNGVILYTVSQVEYQENADYYLVTKEAEATSAFPAATPAGVPVLPVPVVTIIPGSGGYGSPMKNQYSSVF